MVIHVEELWYRKLGYYDNPFSIKPAPFTNEVIGHNLKDIFKKIDDGKILFIEGAYGIGKTTILKHIIHRYGGSRKVIYYSCGLERKMNANDLIMGAGPWVSRVLGIMQHDLLFLVDEAQDLQKSDSDDLFRAYKHGYLKSLVFVGARVNKTSLVTEIEELLQGNIISLPSISQENAVILVKNRLGSSDFLPPDVVKELYLRANRNPRLMLELCEDLCREAIAHGINKIKKKDIELIPNLPKKIVEKKKKKPKKKEEVLEEAIEEAVMEIEAESPTVETLHEFKTEEPLPGEKIRKKRTKK